MSTVSVGERPSISSSLRDATAVAHERAERSDFIGDLMAGRLDAEAYRTLAAQLYFVY
ncbi:MAG: biliverdin-producing heme oxygenase, partial [Gordonia amarae]